MNSVQETAKVRAASISVASNSALVAGKLAVGLSIGSVSVVSEAIHSAVDLVAALIAWFAVRLSGQPADKEHPYGHGKYENLSGAIEAALIFGAAIIIVWEAVAKLRHGGGVDEPVWGVVVMGVSAGTNLLVSAWLMRVGNATDSMALKADAVHLRTDVWTSAGVLCGLAIIWTGSLVAPGLDLHWVDPVAAIAVALLIVRAAWVLALQASRGLLDESLPQEDIDYIRRTALDRGDIRSLHDLKTRKAGPERIIDAHVAVDYSLTVLEGHDKGKSFKRTLLDQWPMSWVNVHVDPCDGSCKAPCLSGCLLSVQARAAEHAAWVERQAKT